jgi:tetratricopeptide (TPR) repeat protein/tRNA A-37 threonylcarbamoyl transferase component Bud32
MTDLLERLRAALADRYLLERELGRGGMAIVYLAEDRRHQRRVALKVLRPELAASVTGERFLREITTAARLAHPNILPLFDSGEADGTLYYTMPYIEGESLRDRLNREKQLPIEDALQITQEVAEALGYAHEQGIIHRDIKPENILFQGGHALVADFGIARAVSAAGAETLTETGLAVGTPAYMSPEQGVGAAELDGRSDLYSLGCVLYEMLTGEPPYAGPTAQAILARKLTDPLPPVRTVRETVPGPIETALTKVLAKNPVDRFATASAFATALASAASSPASERGARAPGAGVLVGTGLGVLVLTRVLVLLLGLPDWLWEGAMALVGVGVPALLLGEWWMWGRKRTWLTPRRSVAASGAALLVLALSGAGYVTSRSLGVGPFATPISKGQLGDQVRVVLADFVPIGVDTNDADAVTELLRSDLQQSPTIHTLARTEVQSALERMRREARRLDAETAQQVAQREGLAAVIGGEVRGVRGQYLLLATVTAVVEERVLVSEHARARDSNDLIDAAGRLSRKLRGRIGEDLRSVRASEPLPQVTTSSLAALRAFAEAGRFADVAPQRSIGLLTQAIGHDSTFAVAYSALAGSFDRLARVAEARAASEQAYRLRDRLPELERWRVTARYFQSRDPAAAEAAYREMLALDPENALALANLADVLLQERRWAEAESVAVHQLDVGDQGLATYWNAVEAQIAQQRFAAAESTLTRMARQGNPMWGELKVHTLLGARDYEGFVAFYDSAHGDGALDAQLALWWRYDLWHVLQARGQLRAAERLRPARSVGEVAHMARLALRFRGDTLSALRLIDDALEGFGWDTIPPRRRAYSDLIPALAEAGRVDRARRLLDECVAAAATDPEMAIDVRTFRPQSEGAIALAEGRLESAVTAYLAWYAAPFRGAGHQFNRGLVEAADALDRLGMTDTAVVLYERALSIPSMGPESDGNHALWYPLVLRRLGELHESLGHPDRAIDYYSRFVDLWQDADPELQTQVEEARAAVRRLTAEPR